MTTTELLVALARECPNGVSFDPMAVRLLRQKVPFEDWQIESLKAEMFQLESGLWYSREMIANDESRLAFDGQAMEWLKEYGCFSIERLLRHSYCALRHIASLEDCASFLRHLGFTVAVWRNEGYFCSQPPSSLDNSLAEISETIAGWLEEADGKLTFHEIEQEMPHLTTEALGGIRAHFLPDVHEVEVGGVPCWCSTKAIHLPEDFSEKLTTIVDTLVALDEKVSASKLEFALNLLYRIRFREEYALTDNDTFMRVCAKHYGSGNNVFSNTKKINAKGNDRPTTGRRVLSPSVIGLEGRALSPATWRAFRSAGNSPRVAEWARRVANGETVENIARESNIKVSTMKRYIAWRRAYFHICKRNGIALKSGGHV